MRTREKPLGRKQGPGLLVGYIDPAWRLRSHGDHGIRRDLAGLLGQYFDQHRIEVTAMGDTLVIACRDRGCATELRFLQRDIRKVLDATGHHGIERVRILLSAHRNDSAAATPSAPRREIPPAARQALRNTAANISDPQLSEALRRLADTGLNNDPDTGSGRRIGGATQPSGSEQGGKTAE